MLIRCGCGRPAELHRPQVIRKFNTDKDNPSYPREWTVNNCTAADEITDAYGEVKFVDSKGNVAKVRRPNLFLSRKRI